MLDKGTEAVARIRECLEDCRISAQEYADVIQALFQAAPRDPEAHRTTRCDTMGSPISNATVSRSFEGAKLIAEDRGSVYTVWIMRTRPEGSGEEVVVIAEFPWGQQHVWGELEALR